MRNALLALGATLAATTAAQAQDSGQDSGWTPQDIIVTGQRDQGYNASEAATLRTPVPILQTPQSIQVLNRRLIDEQSLTTLADALRNVSGVVPAAPSEAVLIKPIVRGFASELYLDGLPQYGDASTYDPSSLVGVERIEVAKGPTSQLFGGGTGAPVGGLINVVSATPSLQPAYAASLRTGSFSTLQPAVDINQPLAANVALRMAAEYGQADDAIDAVTNRRVTVIPSLRLGFADTSLVLRVNYNRITQLEYAGLPFAMAGYPGVDPFHFTGAKNAPRTTVENLALTGVFTTRLTDAITAKVQLRSYNNTTNEYGSTPYLAFYPPSGTVYPIITAHMPNVKINELTFDGSLTGTLDTGGIAHVVIVGAQYDTVDYHGAMGFNLVPVGTLDYADPASDVDFGQIPYDPSAYSRYINTYRTIGVYAQEQMTIAGRLHVLAGLRYSRLESLESVNQVYSPWHRFNRVDPRVGITLDLAPGIALFGGYATGSRQSVFFNPAAVPTTPETSRSWEGGLKLALPKPGISGTLAVFDQTRNHVPLTDMLYVTRQIGQQRARGVEADVIWEPSRRLSLLATYAYTQAKVTKDDVAGTVGNWLSRVPRHSGRLAVRYRVLTGSLKGLGLGAGVTAASGAWTTLPNTDKTAGYAVADAQASYETGRFNLGLSVQNLTNRLYYTPYLYLNQSVVRPGNPRSAFVTVGVKL